MVEMGSELMESREQAVGMASGKPAEALDVVIELLEDIQKTIGKGKPKAVRIKFGNKTITEAPIALTAVAAIAAGLAAVLLTKLSVEMISEE
jgi:hypothetical protein